MTARDAKNHFGEFLDALGESLSLSRKTTGLSGS
jgi:hypothetical protein